MSKAMNRHDWTARAEAYEEAAGHLAHLPYVGSRKREQGHIVSKKLIAEAAKCRRIAAGA